MVNMEFGKNIEKLIQFSGQKNYSLAKELGPSNIRINSIAPGIIDTDMNKNLTKQELEEIKNEIPLERIGKTDSIAKCVEWLIEDEYTTGQVISINGGWIIT